jgi:hypothetical protein
VKDFFSKLKHHFVPSEDNVYRPHILRKPWLIFFLAITLTAEGVFAADLIARQGALDFLAAVLPGEVIALTNGERHAYDLSSLSENAQLDAAAQAKASDMALKGYFSHNGPDGKEPWAWIKEYGYDYQYAGENLAVKFTASQDVVNAWMASPSHKANIVKPAYTEIGVGVAEGTFQGQPATYVVQYFGAPRGSALAQTVATAQPASASTTLSGAPEVQGAATVAPATGDPLPESEPVAAPQQAPHQAPAPWSSFAQQLLRAQTSPSSAVFWVLGAVASLLVLGLALTFFVHIQIQPTDMLVSGAVVAAVAIALLALNSYVPTSAPTTQAAAVFGAMPGQGGFISSSAASARQ